VIVVKRHVINVSAIS